VSSPGSQWSLPPNSPIIQTCAGNGATSINLEIAVFPGPIPSLPTPAFRGNALAPFVLNYQVLDGPPTSYLNVSLCGQEFSASIPLRLYQSEDYGNLWKTTDSVCHTLFGIMVQPMFTEAGEGPGLYGQFLPCWTFPVCHTTLFIAGPDSVISSDGAGVPVSGPSGVPAWTWAVAAISAVLVIVLIVVCARKFTFNKLTREGHTQHEGQAITTNYVQLDDRE